MTREPRDMSTLPRAASSGGWAPDPEPRFGSLLVNKWHEEAVDRPLAVPGSRFRHSDAGKCSRALAYAALDVPRTNLPQPADTFIMRQGDALHVALQEAILDRWPGASEVEVVVGEGDRSGHIDVVVEFEIPNPAYALWESTGAPDSAAPPDTLTRTVSIEIKTIDGFAYKMAVGERGDPEGPKHDHKIQSALNAKEIDADEAVLVYLARGGVSRQAAARKKMPDMLRVCAEWTMTRHQYEPIAEREIARVTAILGMLDDGTLPARKIPTPELPAGHVITKPKTGEWAVVDDNGLWQAGGTFWACTYCPWQDTCSLTDPGRTPVSVLYELGVLDAPGVEE